METLLMTPCFNAAHLFPFLFKSYAELNPQPDYYLWSENNSSDGTRRILERRVSNSFGREELLGKFGFSRDAAVGKPYSVIARVMQALWERARQLNPEFVCLNAADQFPVSPDIIGVLEDWNVDFVFGRVIRVFPEVKDGFTVSARWKHPLDSTKTRMRIVKANLKWLIPHKLLVARPAGTPIPIFDDRLLMGGGFNCYSNRLLQDKRLNWYPIPDKPEGSKEQPSEDFGFCLNMLRLGYKICMDGITVTDHVVYDVKHKVKAWSVNVRKPFLFPK
jgi:hypothetical protein